MTNRHRQVRGNRRAHGLGPRVGALLAAFLVLGIPGLGMGQDVVQTAAERVITISRGSTAILTRPDSITRVSIADEAIAYPVVIPPNQILINANGIGSTSLIVWGRVGPARLYSIEVTADVASLQRQIDDLFPGAGLVVTSTGTSVVLSGQVRDPTVVRKAMELAAAQRIPVVDHVDAPAPEQILLHVEFAEVGRSAMQELGADLVRILNPQHLDGVFDRGGTHEIEALSEGFIRLFLEGDGARLDAIIRVLKNTGEFRSLAQPNLVTREGQEASFLAGGEFPFPAVQAGAQMGAVTIQWREFGVRLNFTPTLTAAGNIRLRVAPEVSNLDFAGGLLFQGFQIPAILTRKVETDVELRPGQTLAIGGLMDHSLMTTMDKIPILGDIPILGFFFRSNRTRQERTELLVLVTPHILDMDNLPQQVLPTGDPDDWDWDRHIRNWIRDPAGGAPVRYQP